MPKISDDTKRYYRERVRSVVVQQPRLGGEGIKRHLERQGLVLDRHTSTRLSVRPIRSEPRWTLNIALASFQDAMGEIVRVGWTVANDEMSEGRDKGANALASANGCSWCIVRHSENGLTENTWGSARPR